jgi:hypothetical protein
MTEIILIVILIIMSLIFLIFCYFKNNCITITPVTTVIPNNTQTERVAKTNPSTPVNSTI